MASSSGKGKGTAFEVILKPAAADAPPSHSSQPPFPPTRERSSLTQEDIERKMREAEEHKKAQELARQERLREHERHAEEVRKKKLSQAEDNKE